MKKTDDVKKIKLNYRELAFVGEGLSAKQCKEIFKTYFDSEVDLQHEIEAEVLAVHFDTVRSVDPRYDGLSLLILKLMLIGSGYTKYLQDAAVMKAGKFTGGKSVFYKLLDPKQLSHVKSVLE